QLNTYQLIKYGLRDGSLYESVPTTDTITHPVLVVPDSLVLSPANDETLDISWYYSAQDVSGFKIYVSKINSSTSFRKDTVFTISDPNQRDFNYSFGWPNQSVEVSIEAFDIRNGSTFSSAKTAIQSTTYPQIEAPINVTATQDKINHIEIKWDSNTKNISYFLIYSDSGPGYVSDTLSPERRSFRHITKFNSTYWVDAFFQSNDGGSTVSVYGTAAYGQVKNGTANHITNVTASMESLDHPEKVKITWSYAADTSRADNMIRIYRDNESIALLNQQAGNEIIYYDEDAVPGKEYLYAVAEISPVDSIISSGADLGSRASDGVINGSIYTERGGIGVEGVGITARAVIDGIVYEKTGITDSDGDYKLENIYYGNGVDYTLTASYANHVFANNGEEVSVTSEFPIAHAPTIFDKTAYLIEGRIARKDAIFGIEGLDIALYTEKADGSVAEELVQTDSVGNYRFQVNPFDATIVNYKVQANTSQNVVTSDNRNAITEYNFNVSDHQFTPANILASSLGVVRADFTEITQYNVTLSINNVCGPMSGTSYRVRIKSDDGKYLKSFATGPSGQLDVLLPPFNYELRVNSAENPTSEIIEVVKYLSVRPVNLNVWDLHLQKESGSAAATTDLNNLEGNFVYHKSPEIAIDVKKENSGSPVAVNRYTCNGVNAPILEQNEQYVVNLGVAETFSSTCPVNEGFLIVKNSAATVIEDTVYYDADNARFPDYAFTAGEPNIVAPYTRALVVEYHTTEGGYQGEKSIAVLVTGSKGLPGSDVIVSLPTNQLFVPLFVLRDPPGDESYSYIEKGATFEKTLTVSKMSSSGGGIRAEGVTSFFGVGVALESITTFGGGDGESAAFNLNYEATERYQTAEEAALEHDFVTGPSADLVVGTGLATGYRISNRISIDPNNPCLIKNDTEYDLSVTGIGTQWAYSTDFINRLINDYTAKKADPNFKFTKDGQTMDKVKTNEYLEVLIKNWQEVIHYHQNSSVPHCNVCETAGLPEAFKTALTNRTDYTTFCNKITRDDPLRQDRKLLKEFTWTEELMNDYKKFRILKSELKEELKNFLPYQKPKSTEEAVNITQKIIDKIDKELIREYERLYGPDIQNFTFSAGAGYDNEVSIGRSSSRGYLQHSYRDSENFAGVLVGVSSELQLLAGIGVQTGTSIENVNTDNRIGPHFTLNFEFSKEKENTVGESTTVGYHLGDDDSGDQFSVTVVRGVDPAHTPYFELLGGRSSCPAVAGTISRFQPQLDIIGEDSSAVKEIFIRDVDPNEAATVQLRLASNNPFGEDLLHYVYTPTGDSPNPYDADIYLPTGGENDGTLTRQIEWDQPQIVQVDIYKRQGEVYYYPDIKLALSPKCEEDFNVIGDTVTIHVQYRRPCSPISIVTEGNIDQLGNGDAHGAGWVVNNATNQLMITLADYNLKDTLLQRVDLEYRKLTSNNWHPMGSVDTARLNSPTFTYAWNVDQVSNLSDGEYEIRAKAFCGETSISYSNTLKGTVDRTSLQLLEVTPTDGILSENEDIIFIFSEDIDCSSFQATNSLLTDNEGAVLYELICKDDQLIIKVNEALAPLEGKTLSVTLPNGITDVFGNPMSVNPGTKDFLVHQSPVYWFPDSLEVRLYEGETKTVTASLYNRSENDQAIVFAESASWLSLERMTDVIKQHEHEVSFKIDTTGLVVGEQETIITATVNGYTENFKLKVNVLRKAPVWQADLSQFDYSMFAVVNFSIDGGANSTDVLDQISVWMNGELRGVANIQEVTNATHVAYLTIVGRSTEINSKLKFRVWDASTGIEYDAHPSVSVSFQENLHWGTTNIPQILTVDSNRDIPAYYPLNAGWNRLSINRTQADMSITNLLEGLELTGEEIIKTINENSTYSAANGWTSLYGLDSLSVDKGYMLRLNKPATLRLSGANASISSVAVN
ncbi:MAG: Ig-like domain-containing protein, partial [Bacteroidota bacterium]